MEKEVREHCVIETEGNLWEYFYNSEAAIVIPTCGNLNKFGHNVMFQNLGKEAKELFPLLPKMIGKGIKRNGGHNAVFLYRFPTERTEKEKNLANFIFTFPVKYNYWDEQEDLKLIEVSLIQLTYYVNKLASKTGILKIALARFDNGGLSWEEHIKPLFLKYLDDHFLVVKHRGDEDEENIYG